LKTGDWLLDPDCLKSLVDVHLAKIAGREPDLGRNGLKRRAYAAGRHARGIGRNTVAQLPRGRARACRAGRGLCRVS
jgi:hypothetical protein